MLRGSRVLLLKNNKAFIVVGRLLGRSGRVHKIPELPSLRMFQLIKDAVVQLLA